LRELGLDASGFFQATVAISSTCIGFVLGAMATDYYPRLCASVGGDGSACKLVNEQTEMALLLAGPVLLAMITLAPWVIQVLYSPSFNPAIEVLRWQMLGDIIKVASWPMGFILMAAGRGKLFIVTQLIWNATYLGIIEFRIHEWGLAVTGVGYFISHFLIFFIVAIFSAKLIGFINYRKNIALILFLLISGALIIYLEKKIAIVGVIYGIISIIIMIIYSFIRLNSLINFREILVNKIKNFR
jgi:PST family polysaccharide transporter